MLLVDSRRLQGPSLELPRAGALVEVALQPGEEPALAAALFAEEVDRLGALLGVACTGHHARHFPGGAALAFVAPLDVLLFATDLADLAVVRATERLASRAPADPEPALASLRERLAAQRRPALLALEAECARRDLPLLWDDEALSIGMGRYSRSYPIESLPPLDTIPWESLRRIPVALVTGTNGKTTSARLLAHVLRCAGLRDGLSSTDFVAVGGETLARGDYTGPAAARLVLRHPDVEVAVLETARGGILRRGLAIDRADVALLTNVADDHLGEYGIHTVEELARAKAVTASVVPPSGRIVLCADDPVLRKLYASQPETFRAPVVWFSLDPNSAQAVDGVQGLERSGEAWVLEAGRLTRLRKGPAGIHREPLLAADALPFTMGGAASYNISNALGVCAAAGALGVPDAVLCEGLRTFLPNRDNPGRANFFDVGGVRVLVDFGHNAHAVLQLGALLGKLRSAGAGLTVISGCAGDRSDKNLQDLAAAIAAMQPSRVLLRDLPGYLRGRQPGEVPALLTHALRSLPQLKALAAGAVSTLESEVACLRAALDGSRPGDLVALLVHLDSDAVDSELRVRGAVRLD